MSYDLAAMAALRNTIASGNGTSLDRKSLIDQTSESITSNTNSSNLIGSTNISSTSSSNNVIDNISNIGKSNILSSLTSNLIGTTTTTQTDRRIKLRPKVGVSTYIKTSPILSPLAATNGLIFPSDLRIGVNNRASYGEQKTTHMNQDFRYYTNTPAMQFDISGTFTAQNTQEAAYMLAAFHFLSLMTKMHTGNNSSTDSSIGLPPPVLLLSGLGLYNFNDLPVIMTSGSYNFDPAVDLVTVSINGVPNDVPSMCTIMVSVVVQNTPAKLRTFDWNSFASGKLLSAGGWK